MNIEWAEPKDSTNPDDVEAAERALQMMCGWFCNPVFVNGDYPDIMKARLASAAKASGLDRSPLPEFTEEEKQFNRGKLTRRRRGRMYGRRLLPLCPPVKY